MKGEEEKRKERNVEAIKTYGGISIALVQYEKSIRKTKFIFC